jgi:hypothetical protein
MLATAVAAGAASELNNCRQPAAAHPLLLRLADVTVQQHRQGIGSARAASQTAQSETSVAEWSLACPSLLRIRSNAREGQANVTLRRVLDAPHVRCSEVQARNIRLGNTAENLIHLPSPTTANLAVQQYSHSHCRVLAANQ